MMKKVMEMIENFTDIFCMTKNFLKTTYRPTLTELHAIFDNNVTDYKRIENLLDKFLDLSFHKIGKRQFYRLLNYYYKINKDNAQFYEKQYNELN